MYLHNLKAPRLLRQLPDNPVGGGHGTGSVGHRPVVLAGWDVQKP